MSEPDAKRVTLDDMIGVIGAEADRIRTTQAALVKSFVRMEADPVKMWEAEVLETAERFLQLIKPQLPAVKAIISSKKSTK